MKKIYQVFLVLLPMRLPSKLLPRSILVVICGAGATVVEEHVPQIISVSLDSTLLARTFIIVAPTLIAKMMPTNASNMVAP